MSLCWPVVSGGCALPVREGWPANSSGPKIGPEPTQVVDVLFATLPQKDPQQDYRLAIPVHIHQHLMHADSLGAEALCTVW